MLVVRGFKIDLGPFDDLDDVERGVGSHIHDLDPPRVARHPHQPFDAVQAGGPQRGGDEV